MKIIKIVIIVVLFYSCKNTSNFKENKKVSKIVVALKEKFFLDLKDFLLYVNADEEDFKNYSKNDTIFIQKTLYNTLKNSILKPKKDVSFVSIYEKLDISFKQNTIDDNPAAPLDIFIDGPIIKQNLEKQYDLLKIDEFIESITANNFDKIKDKSIKFQTNFFENLLKNKKEYEKCCPEYINQAESFLTEKKEYKTLADLSVFSFVKKRTLVIEYFKNNQKKDLVIIYND